MKHLLTLVFTLLVAAFPLLGQTEKPSADTVAKPRAVTYCELSKDPAAYNHELVRLTAFVTHGFEDFQITEPTCVTKGFSVWVMYGGKAESNTAYCCPGEAGQATRPESLSIEGIEVPLVNDLAFRSFTDLLKKEPDTTVHVTVVGRFFSGEKKTINGSTFWGGAGHLGCCSLLVIQSVESFDRHTRGDLDYTAEAGWYEKEGCSSGAVRYQRYASIVDSDGAAAQVIAEQKMADSGEAWAFKDPRRVAVQSLKPFYGTQTPVLQSARKTPARQVFRWRKGEKMITVVVTRPYWLSFYAASDSVAWVSTTIKEAECR